MNFNCSVIRVFYGNLSGRKRQSLRGVNGKPAGGSKLPIPPVIIITLHDMP